MTTRKTKAQKARSAAARKGWETRKEQRRAKFIDDHQQAYKAGFDFAESMQRVNSECAREMVWGDLRQPDPPAPPPICTDCKYSWYSSDVPSLVRCAAPQLSKRSPVDGVRFSEHDVAKVNRAYQHLCGASGLYFAPKEVPPPLNALPDGEPAAGFHGPGEPVASAYWTQPVPGPWVFMPTLPPEPPPEPPTFLQRILGWFR